MIAEAVTRWLGQEGRQIDEAMRAATAERLAKRFAGQFLQDREIKPGRLSATSCNKPCALMAWYAYKGTVPLPLPARTLLNFYVGDIVEATVLQLAACAGVPIDENNRPLTVTRNGVTLRVHPDGRMMDGADGMVNVEVKKVTAWTFDEAKREGISDLFGYLTQASLGVEAWREAGFPQCAATEFVLISPDRMEIQSLRVPYNAGLVDAAMKRAAAAIEPTPPPIPKELMPRNGKLSKTCGYCSYVKTCWPNAKRAGSAWIIPAREKAAA